MARHRIIATKEGKLVFVYNDSLRCLLNLGAAAIRRASEVEPTADLRWSADLSRVSGPQIGPFRDRDAAIAAEVEWLNDHLKEVAAIIQ